MKTNKHIITGTCEQSIKRFYLANVLYDFDNSPWFIWSEQLEHANLFDTKRRAKECIEMIKNDPTSSKYKVINYKVVKIKLKVCV